MTAANHHILALSAQIVSAHAGNNVVENDVLPDMIRNVYNELTALSQIRARGPVVVGYHNIDNDRMASGHSAHDHGPRHNMHVHPTYGQTVFGDHLICMEDGLSMKMLKRHLLTVHGMTPDEYRAKWDLPESYPMVAADYAKLRSSLALQSGLGLKPEDRPSKGRKGRRG